MKIKTKTLSQKVLGLGLVLGLSVSLLFPGAADARLIFTTESDGVNADGYHIDNDDSSVDTVDLFFGASTDAFLKFDMTYDGGTGKFDLSHALDLSGNELLNFIVENSETAPTCDAASIGRLYYDTSAYPADSDGGQLLFCTLDELGGYEWVANRDNSVTAAMLNADTAGLGLIQAGDGSLQVNTDGVTLELNGDEVRIKEEGVTTLEIADDTIQLIDMGDSSVASAEIVDESVEFVDVKARSIVDELSPEFQNMTLWADTTAPDQHVGTMEADYDVADDRSYYKWSTNKDEVDNSLHSYTIVLQYGLPENFIEWADTNQIKMDIRTHTDSIADNKLDVAMIDTDETGITLTSGGSDIVSSVADDWETVNITFDENQVDAHWEPGLPIVLRIKMSSKSDVAGAVITQHPVYLGRIQFYYDVK